MIYTAKSVFKSKYNLEGFKNPIVETKTLETDLTGDEDLERYLIDQLDVIVDNNHIPKEPEFQDILSISLYGNAENKVQSVFDFYKKRYEIYKNVKEQLEKMKSGVLQNIVLNFDKSNYRFATDEDDGFIYEYLMITIKDKEEQKDGM